MLNKIAFKGSIRADMLEIKIYLSILLSQKLGQPNKLVFRAAFK